MKTFGKYLFNIRAADFLLILGGSFLYALSTLVFIFPHSLLLGGTSGVSVILESFLGYSPGTILMVINSFLIILAFVLLGKEMGDLEGEELEQIWGQGYANADNLQPDENGLEAIARYITKQQKNRRKWARSRNLTMPKVRTSDTKVSNARVRRLAVDFPNSAKEIMEKLYPQYTHTRTIMRFSDVVDGAYIRCVMRRTKGGGGT